LRQKGDKRTVLLAVLSAGVSAACVLASARRLAWAVAPMKLEPRMVLQALEGDPSGRLLKGLIRVFAADERSAWERQVFTAISTADPVEREALLSEERIELEERGQRWVRVPRVCARVATSAGFLFASVALTQGMALAPGEDDLQDPQSPVHAAIASALGALAIGIAAAAFCAAVHIRSKRVARERMSAISRLLEFGSKGPRVVR
jgi:hypothetical protein